ncbi:MAG: Hpt domain-containing protein [Hyphomicrobiales bacterium]|nr:Hpt domain-containing protein [Hyphomicrobiales bacterium]
MLSKWSTLSRFLRRVGSATSRREVFDISDDPYSRLRLRFLARSGDQLAVLKAATNDRGKPGNASGAELLKAAHSLAGGGGTFGFPAVSESASHLETLLLQEPLASPDQVQAALHVLILETERILA